MAPSMMANVSSGLQEILFAQRLADNDKKTRDRALKKLNKYLATKSSAGTGFTLEDLIKIWKGLFYCMYMADKPLVQEEVAEQISKLILSVGNVEDRHGFCQAALATFAREWDGIDTFRIDKFMMFVRRVMRQVFVHLKEMKWSLDETMALANIFEETVLVPTDNINSLPMGLKIHFCDVFLEELAKIGGEELDSKVILALLQPFIKVLAMTNLKPYRERVKERIFRHLMRQSDLGIQHQEGLVENEFMVDVDEENGVEGHEEMEQQNEEGTPMEDDGVLDPRAGEVDVFLPQLKPDFSAIASALLAAGSVKGVANDNRNDIYRLAQEFRDIVAGEYPLAMPEDNDKLDDDIPEEEIEKAMKRIQNHEEKLKKKLSEKRKRDDDEMDEVEEELSRLQERRQPLQKKKRRKKKKSKAGSTEDKPKRKIKSNSRMKEEVRSKVEDKLKEVLSNEGVPAGDSLKNENIILDIPVDFPGRKRKRRKSTPFEVTDLPPEKVNRAADKDLASEIPATGQIIKENVESREETLSCRSSGLQTVEHTEAKNQNVSESKVVEECKEIPPANLLKKKKKNRNKVKSSTGQNETDKALMDANPNPTITPTTDDSSSKSTPKTAAFTCISNSVSIEKVAELQMNYSEEKQKKVINKEDTNSDPWSAPLQEGECEVFIESKKLKKKKKMKMQDFLKKTPDNNKKIKINLKNNQEHDYKDYVRTVRLSPNIPFSAEKKPKSSLLKASPSPIMVRKSPVKKLKALAGTPKHKVVSPSPNLALPVKKRLKAVDFFSNFC
ncbi:uncharacterized protein LOC143036912 isoform X2 [Oratosquilla oratoria]|uniref:uncharacterized protein LOC143036912 isoform X2 n=1 Tax=Oratosquilla oratoria TaxID=337810 RepID=UPI003F75D7FC